MSHEISSRAWELARKAMDLTPDQQLAFLSEECSGDEQVTKEVMILLKADAENLEEKWTIDIGSAMQGPSRGRHENLLHSTIGSYNLVSILGRGGAGIVYLATRSDSTSRSKVAVKVVDSQDTDARIVARFKAERRILSNLRHEHIARLLDFGESPDGCLYIAMEYVDGTSIDRFCDANRLSISARLRLFLQVCSAVQYAHRHLIVHRDIKPANILVTEKGVPKLLDFGIAKMLGKPNGPAKLTVFGDRIMTPEYASPEQIEGRRVTTSSDVYSLGILLYELLSGIPAYSLRDVKEYGLEKTVCSVDPPRPSVAILASHNQLLAERAARARVVTLDGLAQALAGDIDAIILRALRKEPDRRYQSVEALVADIERFLRVEPVLARQGTWFYQANRFLKRRWLPVTLSAVAAFSITLFAVVTYGLYSRAAHERDDATQIAQVLSGIFANANPLEAARKEVSAVELLDSATQRVRSLNRSDSVKAQLMLQISEALLNLGSYDRAVSLLSDAEAIERSAQRIPTMLLARVLRGEASAYKSLGKFEAANEKDVEAMQILSQLGSINSEEYANALRAKASIAHAKGNVDAAKASYRQAIAIFQNLKGHAMDEASTLSQLATLYNWTNELDLAYTTARDALRLMEGASDRLPALSFVRATLGDVMIKRGDIDGGTALIEKSVAVQREIYANEGPKLAKGLGNLARARESQGRYDDALSLVRESITLLENSVGRNHYETGYQRISLGRLYVRMQKWDEAVSVLALARKTLEEHLPATHAYVTSAQYWYGEALIGSRRFNEAIPILLVTMENQKNASPHWLASRTEGALGFAYYASGYAARARVHLCNAYDSLENDRDAQEEAKNFARKRVKMASIGSCVMT